MVGTASIRKRIESIGENKMKKQTLVLITVIDVAANANQTLTIIG
jgi:hypothetical protein